MTADHTAAPAATDWRSLHGSHFEGLRVLVTGGAGFIGSHLCEALVSLGAAVVALDDLSGGHERNLAHLPSGDGPRKVSLVRASIMDVDALARAAAGCTYVLHQAALGSVPRSIEIPRLYHDVNATGTLNVLEAARAAGTVRRVTFAASSSAYGDTSPGEDATLPKHEVLPPRPLSPYAATKVAGEALCKAYAESYGLDTAPLRYFNIFGPRQSPDNAYAAVIAAFAKALVAGRRPVIYGDGEQSRDFTFVHNAVHANLLACRHPGPVGGDVLNVACGRRVTVNELAAEMARLFGRPDLTPEHRPDRPGDVKHSLADLSRAEATIGYEPVVGFVPGLAAAGEWYRRELTAPDLAQP